MYVINVFYKTRPEAVDNIEDGNLSAKEDAITHSFVILYDVLTGITHIQFKKFHVRETIFLLFSRVLLKEMPDRQTPLEYDFMTILKEPEKYIHSNIIKHINVTMLQIDYNNSNIRIENSVDSRQSACTMAKYIFGEDIMQSKFDKSGATFSLVLAADTFMQWPERAVHITFQNSRSCIIHATASDQCLCLQLLNSWGIIE